MKETQDVENNPRLKRIDRLFDELRYEIQIGMIRGEIDEHLSYQFIVPHSKSLCFEHDVVICKFESKPGRNYYPFDGKPIGIPFTNRLRLVKNE